MNGVTCKNHDRLYVIKTRLSRIENREVFCILGKVLEFCNLRRPNGQQANYMPAIALSFVFGKFYQSVTAFYCFCETLCG